jgi:hypothetical protein
MLRPPLRITIALVFAFALIARAESAAPNVVLVELFTSEGCSSCPPADALLREVNGKLTGSGQLVVGISEHVTYWNQLGWQDPYSSADYVERQEAYSHRFHLEGVYTPQMVINGAEQIVGSDRGALLRAEQAEAGQRRTVSLGIASLQVANDKSLTVNYTISGVVPAPGLDVMAVLADDADRSNVLRGENSGETLTHVSVARSLTQVAKVKAEGDGTVHIPLPPSFEAAQKHHLILLCKRRATVEC